MVKFQTAGVESFIEPLLKQIFDSLVQFLPIPYFLREIGSSPQLVTKIEYFLRTSFHYIWNLKKDKKIFSITFCSEYLDQIMRFE